MKTFQFLALLCLGSLSLVDAKGDTSSGEDRGGVVRLKTQLCRHIGYNCSSSKDDINTTEYWVTHK